MSKPKARKSQTCPFCGLPKKTHHAVDKRECAQAHKKCDEAGLAAYYRIAKDVQDSAGYAKADAAYDRAYASARDKMLRDG